MYKCYISNIGICKNTPVRLTIYAGMSNYALTVKTTGNKL